jgi:glycosyltransferase involved in cell wall biosynthesis
MRTVLVYRGLLLPSSETFIKAQIGAFERWRGALIGRRLVHQLALDGLDVTAFEPEHAGYGIRAAHKIWRTLGGLPNLSRLKRMAPALVHVHFGMDALEAAPIARALGLPMVVTLHGFDINIHKDWWRRGNGGWFMRRYPERLIKLGGMNDVHFVAVSDAIKSRAVEFGIPEDKIHTLYIGLDVAMFKPGPTPIVQRRKAVLFVGRLVEKKGCEFLLRAMQDVTKVVKDAELTIVGDGPQRKFLEALAISLGVRAEFKGVLSSTDVRAELDQARVFCLPSIMAANGDAEGLPIVLLEAQAKGVPVVTSARGGVDEGIMEGVTGFGFAERSVADLARLLQLLLSDDEVAERMALAAPRFIREKFDIRYCTQKLELFYDSIAG